MIHFAAPFADPRSRALDVLFVMPPGGSVAGFTEHIGIAFLRATLDRAGITSAQYLPPGGAGTQDFARALAESRPRVVGFTVYESNLRACRALAAVARAALPEAVLLAGGPNATFSPEETLDLLGVDGCLRGAGEGTVARLVEAVLGGAAPRDRLAERLAAIPNLVLRAGEGVARTAPASLASFQREHFRTLDDLPSPYQAGLLTTAAAGLLTARGCNQHCTYCSFAAISDRKVAYHSVERVLEDLAAWRVELLRGGRPPGQVAILDDAFTLAPDRARAVCEGIVARGLQLPFHCETRADRVDGELLRLMRRAGFVGVSFGLESAVPRVLRAVGKVQPPDTPADPTYERERAWLAAFRAAVRQARKAGLEVHVSVIGGLPGESAADFRATLDAVRSLGAARYAHNLLLAMPGTPLHERLDRHGLATARDPDTGAWTTRHAYDVGAVPPAPRSNLRDERAAEALRLVDALCGRPHPELAAPSGVWAVVLHGVDPDSALAAWLAEVLPVGGLVLPIAAAPAGGAAWRAWARVLLEARVAHGPLVLLSPERRTRAGLVYRTVGGAGGTHRLELTRAWEAAGRSFAMDASGRCRIRIWLGGHPEAVPPGRATPAPRLPQIADGCRWWSRGARCARPAVLHVRPDRSVAPCWSGPVAGWVGDAPEALRRRLAGMARGRATCPMGPGAREGEGRSRVEWYEVESRLSGGLAATPLATPGRRGT